MRPTVTALDDGRGIELLDPIENTRFVLRTPETVRPTEFPADEFDRPIDIAVSVEASEIRIPQLTGLYLHSPDGELLTSFDPAGESLSWEEPCILDVNVAPTKLYLAVEKPFTVFSDGDEVVLDFEDAVELEVGVRSLHERPAATITTTPDPVGAMRALSYLGSALKTTSPERSYPTLRGHPPLVELGEEFDVPEGLEKPDTGVRLELPAEFEYVYPAASLAYYLGAEMVPSDEPRLVAGEYSYDFERDSYEEEVSRVLKQVFLFDCITRTEGLYPLDLHERMAVEPLVDLDFADLYDRPLVDRLEAYLSVPYEIVEDHVPDWNLTVDVDPRDESLEALPFVARELAIVRTIDSDQSGEKASDSVHTAVGDFHRSSGPVRELETVSPDPADTIEHSWVGDGVPIGANKLTVDSLRRSLDVDPDTTIDVHVVCNDEQMREEDAVAEYYELRELPKFEVSMHYGVTTDELRELLAESTDFLHFVSHVDEDGMVCPDGNLDARELDSVGVKAFALNACASYEQGMALLDSGSLGGVITLSEVGNTSATLVGTALARALAAGFSLRLGVEVAKTASHGSSMFATIGDGGVRLCQCKETNPMLLRAEALDDETLRTEVSVFPAPTHGLGTVYDLFLDASDGWYLVGGVLDTFDLDADQFQQLLDISLKPIEFDGELLWSHEVSADDFYGPG